uniref:Peroxidasin n=1 Tax=Timema monikensis TaxID=170555 RepID=A0A7R9EF11_9NEOP|nr:unnamed protein product [Timema monikensis]
MTPVIALSNFNTAPPPSTCLISLIIDPTSPSSTSNLEDVDLLVGGSLETPVYGAVLGPTLVCVLAHQFAKVRNSDRFWYENDIPPSSFNREELEELRKVTLAGLLCDNTPGLQDVQSQAFVQEDPYLGTRLDGCLAERFLSREEFSSAPDGTLFVYVCCYSNVRIACHLQPSLDLSVWREEAGSEISDEMVMQAVEKAETDLRLRRQREYQLWTKSNYKYPMLTSIIKGITYGGADPKSPVGIAAAFSKANNQALALANTSILLELASEDIMNSLQSSGLRRKRRQTFDTNRDIVNFATDSFNDVFSNGLQSVDVSPFIPQGSVSPDCDSLEDRAPCSSHGQFRTITGHCNNLRNPKIGKSLATFARLLPPAYENGVSHPRLTSQTGAPLPSPRLVSTMIHADISNLHTRYSLMLMQFAQFVDHDITFTPVHKGFFSSIPDCRSCDSPRTIHPECMPISVPSGDHYYPQFNHSTGERLCFPFMRSLPGQLTLGAREQINQNSAFLDASQVYGEHSCMARALRGFGGRMNVTRHPVKGKDLLPQSPSHPECRAPSGYCFIAGDGRASEQPALTVIHTLYMREHNRLADSLHRVNPHWDEERLYQHARRILIALQQHIIYNEFLPRLLGWTAINLYELKLRPQGYYKGTAPLGGPLNLGQTCNILLPVLLGGRDEQQLRIRNLNQCFPGSAACYSPTCNPTIVNEFAAAAFRIGHSLLRPHIPRLSPTYQVVDPPILLRSGFFNPDMIYQVNMIDEIARGLVSTPVENMDQFITGEVTNHLFEDRKIPHSGIDLIALNIQRGRDHGIRSYNDYRALCNLKRASSFDDLSREVPPEVIVRFKRIYTTVDDIDLFPGGMSERPVQGGLVGPTFACIIGIQFRQLRKCDRFWYENEDQVVRFTEAQLGEIRKATLAKLLCENMDVASDIQRAALDQPSDFLNPRVPCRSLPEIDLSAWRETSQGCQIGGRSVAVGGSGFPTPCTSCVCTAEGAQCASLRITDCSQLLREATRDAILRDDVCVAQCGFLLNSESGKKDRILLTTTGSPRPLHGRSLPPTELIPPPPKTRPPPLRRRLPPPTPTFGDFKLPNLSSFVG